MSDANASSTAPATTTKPMISFEEFAKVDLRVARITHAENHPSADRLLKLQLDDGSGTPRQICAGIKGHYTPEGLVGKLIVIVANLAPRTIRGEESRGMLLAASDAAKGEADRSVVVLAPMSDIAPGAIVS
ncbi:MAG: methionine--tRNA ligase subunit beta [Phycisphaerales bacterium]|jgi:methionyl-tRNA synthetase|nr:methionine--tRNA ligase subunit beta [Phycisphaerales bacterium]